MVAGISYFKLQFFGDYVIILLGFKYFFEFLCKRRSKFEVKMSRIIKA